MKTILIVGSSGGLGTALTDFFIQQKCQLVLHFYTKRPEVQESENTMLISANIADEDEVKSMMKSISDRFGKLDIVINNAGVSISEISWKTKLSNWDKTIAVNLTGPFLVSKYAVPIMKSSSWGRIIFISSIVAQTGFVGTSAYAASKAGLLGLTKSLAKEVAPKGITVNAIALGYFNVGMIADVPDVLKANIVESIPNKALGDPKQLFETIQFIISENSDYLTGQTINLNGGLYMA
ncbi:MAG: SDR family oxidoreductase [Putridiphycobacter sp.]|nr:SDR family oxidoreductase [Putridiphycobacter sp.]